MSKDIKIILVFRKTKYLIASIFIAVGLIISFWGTTNLYKSQTTMASPLGNKVILIDPGHGGIDAGASDNGAIEKELNLKIAMFLKSYIEENGGVCYMTRTEDTNTADPNRAKGTTQKMSDLKTRKKNIEDYKADIFISIHMNKFSQSKYYGLQVFYDGSQEENKKLGESIQNAAKKVLNDNNTRTAKATGDKIYVLKGNPIPSALVECGFLSNTNEAKKLKTPEYQRKVAWGIFLGIAQYFSH